jgi:enoyl-CoA hydratase
MTGLPGQSDEKQHDRRGGAAMSVQISNRGTVAIIEIDAPRRNALTPTLANDLVSAFGQAESNPNTTAIVIGSGGPTFCSGADLEMLRRVASDPLEEHAYAALGSIYTMFERLQELSLPTVAAVNGGVVGAGINLALGCDLRIVGHDLEVAGFARAGVHPGGGHLQLLVERLPRPSAAAIALFAQPLDAQAAVACGFALEAVSTERTVERAIELASCVGADKQLVQATTRSFRLTAEARLKAGAAAQLERAPQVWSLRRRFSSSFMAEYGNTVRQPTEEEESER